MDKNNKDKKQLPITVSDLDKERWIKTPVPYVQQGVTLNKMQQDVMFMVSKQMQSYVNDFLGKSHDDTFPQHSAIPNDAFQKNGMLLVRLKMSDLVDVYAYSRLEAALKDLYKLHVRTEHFEQKKNRDGELMYDRHGNPKYMHYNDIMPMFSRISFPDSNSNGNDTSIEGNDGRKAGYIEMEINSSVVSTVFDMNHGFVEHLARIAKYSNNDATSKLYVYLKMRSYQLNTRTFKVTPVDLKKTTGHIIFDLKTDQLAKEDYPRWNDYVRRVIEPAKKDLDRLCLENNSEFSFEYHCVYNNGRGRGVPDYVEFTLHASRLGIAHKQNKGKSQGVIMQSLFENEPLTMNEQDRRNWLAVVKAFNGRGGLKPLFRRATFVDARNVKDDRGVVRHLFAISMCQEDHAKMSEPKVMADYEKFLKKIKEMFGTKYYPALYIFKSK